MDIIILTISLVLFIVITILTVKAILEYIEFQEATKEEAERLAWEINHAWEKAVLIDGNFDEYYKKADENIPLIAVLLNISEKNAIEYCLSRQSQIFFSNK